MARYLIERTFPDGLELPDGSAGADVRRQLVTNNDAEHVTWIRSFVSADRTKTYCIYDGSSPEAIRRAATASDLPVDSITEISVLDPYGYVGAVS